MNRIAIFCGSSSGNNPKYRSQAAHVGRVLAERKIELVYGGSNVGLMTCAADAALQSGGSVIGVLPRFMQTKELAHPNLTRLILTDTMHERKSIMNDLSDGVIALPGGFGTMDEMFEMLTWGQLNIHRKPIGLLNTAGYYDALEIFIRHMAQEGFLSKENRRMVLISESVEDLLAMMEQYIPPEAGKWIPNKNVL